MTTKRKSIARRIYRACTSTFSFVPFSLTYLGLFLIKNKTVANFNPSITHTTVTYQIKIECAKKKQRSKEDTGEKMYDQIVPFV